MVEVRCAYKILVGKYEGKKLLGRPKCRWIGNVKLISKKQGVKMWNEFTWSRTGSSGWLL
jgi:hypothetical protein